VAGKEDGESPDVHACGYFVLLEVADAAAATAEESGGAVVPAPLVASSSSSSSSGAGGARAGASIGRFEGSQEALCGGCAAH